MSINNHLEAQWFKGAGLGLFIHWGIASLSGVDLSWGMISNAPWNKENKNIITPEEYWGNAEKFNPVSYDPDKWLAAAREAGMEYAVFTTKHHDGYAMWPSEYFDFGVKQHMGGRDLVGEYVSACRRQGLKTGFYFSMADWHQQDARNYLSYVDSGDYGSLHQGCAPAKIDPQELVRFERTFKGVKGQIYELLTRYGRIDLIWFDPGIWERVDDRMGEICTMIRSLQPHIVINTRSALNGRYFEGLGDLKSPECVDPGSHYIPAPLEGWWELCYTWGEGWGYNRNEFIKGLEWTLDLLAKTVGWGGNLLLNVGPKPNGELPEAAYQRMAELAGWMKTGRPSVKRVSRGPWPSRCNFPITCGIDTWYVHILRHQTSRIEVRDVIKPASVKLLRNGKALEYEFDGRILSFELHDGDRTSPDEVVAISWPYGSYGL